MLRGLGHWPVAGMCAVLVALLISSGCSGGKTNSSVGTAAKRDLVPVTVSTVTRKTIPLQLRAIGNVQSYSTVSVRAQVAGELTRVHFKEGQDVKKKDILFTIDPRPYENLLKQSEANLARDLAQASQAEANLARDLAQAKNAEADAKRYAALIEDGIVARDQYDRMQTIWQSLEATLRADKAAVENAQAAVRADRAAIENAKLQLEYCTIRSPIDGRTGSLLVHPGNIVKLNEAAPLVIIHQLSPIYMAFSIPEQVLPDLRKYMAAGTLEVAAVLSDHEQTTPRGELTFVDNAVDPSTGTIHLKATFPNTDRSLWPGQFVNVATILSRQSDAIVVPTRATQTGQQGSFVFVVKPDLTVESRPITVSRAWDGEAVVEKGLAVGERVVTDGQLRLYPSAKVEIKSSLGTDLK
ncbi:MAG: efflux RND transporter periplasmic adaptor subunit [Acidobacteria bacterium]|nr:efflux RND transporter periplasmic adaptor subunit [Acidobacteriota bacterium]MBI3656880.1 efflux RND transporter periplasmic adaptor subunit [Acidobacteriota bacterium]